MLWSQCRQNQIKKVWIVTLKTESFFPSYYFPSCSVTRSAADVQRATQTISRSLYVLMDPFLYFLCDPFHWVPAADCLAAHSCAGTSVGEPTFIIIILWIPFIIIKYVSIKGMDSPAPPTSSLSILTDKNLLLGVTLIKDGGYYNLMKSSPCSAGFLCTPFTCSDAPSQWYNEISSQEGFFIVFY